MAQALEQVARLATGGRLGAKELPWEVLRYQHTQAIRAALQETISERTNRPLTPGYLNKILAALRGVLKESWRLGHMSAEDFHRAIDLEPVRGATVLRGRALEPNEVASLFHVLQRDPSPAGARDAAVLALGLAGGGLRRAEMSGLELSRSLQQATWVLTVDGKGSRVREVPRVPGVALGNQPSIADCGAAGRGGGGGQASSNS